MSVILDSLRSYVDAGGFVMPPLIIATLVLWYAVGVRFQTLRRGSSAPISALAKKPPTSNGVIARAARCGARVIARYPERISVALDDAYFPTYQELKRGRSLITSIVIIAPLVGLLGTVAGMIETFDSLGEMTLFSQSGGIAGGISQALFSTQMGLCVAVPGVVVGRLLDRRQRSLEDELDQLKAHFCHVGGAAA